MTIVLCKRDDVQSKK